MVLEKGTGVFINEQCINPLKRKEAFEIAQMASGYNKIRKIVVFGSAITDRCTEMSDIDLWIDYSDNCYDEYGVFTKEADSIICEIEDITNYNADILFNEQLIGSYVEKAALKGVCIYVQDDKKRVDYSR